MMSRLKFQRQFVADTVAGLAWLAGISAPQRRAGDALTIVTFHRVLPAETLSGYPYPCLAVLPEELDWMLTYLTTYYDIGAVTPQLRRLHSGETPVRPLVALSFDDGQWDNFAYAAPLLAKHNVSASFYVPVEHVRDKKLIWHDQLGFSLAAMLPQQRSLVEKIIARHHLAVSGNTDIFHQVVQGVKALVPQARGDLVAELGQAAASGGWSQPDWARLMTWKEIRALAQDGHEIGSHSMSHNLLPQLDKDELEYEVVESRQILEQQLQQEVSSFCYPNGDNDERVRRTTATAGYINAVSTAWGLNRRDQDNFALQRCDINGNHFKNRKGRLSAARTALRLANLQPGLR